MKSSKENLDEELNIGELAEEILKEKAKEPKKKHIPSVKRALDAYHKKKAKEQKEFAWRKQLSKVWPKQKPS